MLSKLVFVLLLLAGGVYAYLYWGPQDGSLTLDNAWVSGRIMKIRAPINGIIAQTELQKGSHFESRQVLFRYELTTTELKIEQAREHLRQVINSQLQKCFELDTASRKMERISLQQQHDKARLDRREALLQQSLLTQEVFEDSQNQHDITNLDGNILRSEYQRLQHDNRFAILARPEVKLAQSYFKQALYEQSKTTIKLFQGGFVYEVMVYPGQEVEKGDLLAIVVLDEALLVEANVLESKVSQIYPGQRVDILPDTHNGKSFAGRVKAIVPSAASALSPIPRRNTDSNWIKVSQRIPVLVEFIDPPPATLPIGSSVKLRVLPAMVKSTDNTADQSVQQATAEITELPWQQTYRQQLDALFAREVDKTHITYPAHCVL